MKIALTFAMLSLACGVIADNPCEGWSFTLTDADGRQHAARDIRLPHDWAIGGRFDARYGVTTGALPCHGTGVYTRTFDLETESWLEFGGIMDHATVKVDGKVMAERPYGYSSFRVAIPAGRHLVEVTAAPLREGSRWYPGAGIYRPVRIVPRTEGEILPEDVVIVTEAVSEHAAKVNVTWPGGKRTITIDNPRLWSPEDPHLYSLDLGGRKYRYGLRTLRFDPASGFYLNGRHRQMKGVCLHHDLGVLGAAFERTAAKRQLQLLKDIGCDAIRTAHNPPAPELLDLCDEMGFMVMVEAFDMWEMPAVSNDYSNSFREWHRRDLTDMIRRDRNHPCVVMWSVGNEVGEYKLPTAERGVAIGQELTRIVKELDATRPVTIASFVPKSLTNGLAAATEVFGANYLPAHYASFLANNPGKGLIATETCSTVTARGEYFLSFPGYDLWGPHSNDYAPDVEFAAQKANPAVYGEFVWTGFDYLGEPDPCAEEVPPARSAYFGIFDLCGFPKDRAWIYRSTWRPEVPTAHLLPHWNWPGREGGRIAVHAYSSGDTAELFVNGISQGRKTRGKDEYRFRWDDVTYSPGEISLKTWKNGQPWAEDCRKTSGTPAAFRVTAENPEDDLVYYRVEILDAAGIPVPTAANRLHFKVTDGEFVGACNGDPKDYEAFSGGTLKAFNGLCQVVARRTAGKTPLLTVTSQGLAAQK